RSDALENARRKLEMYRDQVLARAADTRAIPTQLRIAGIAVVVLGAAGATIAAMNGQTIAAALSGIAAAVGLVIALLPGASTSTQRDPVEEQIQAQIQESEKLLLAAETEWSNCLTRVGLSPTLSPEAKDETLRAIESAADELHHIDEMEGRITRLRKIIVDNDQRYGEVARAAGETPSGVDVAAGIELLDTHLTEARTAKAKCESLAADVHTLEQRIREHEEEKAHQEQALEQMLAAHGVATPAELEERYRRFCKANELRRRIGEMRHDIEARVGPGEAYRSLVETIENTPLEDIRSELDSIQMHITTLEGELASTNQEVGALDTELKTLESEQDLVAREAHIETLKQQLQDAFREWLIARIALWGINSAVSRYEEERQPEVIRAAQDAFSAMTGGRYVKLIKSIDDDELHVRDRDGNDRTVEQLSRGTREQLYLAMRLGLIEQYEQNTEPLPVIMDDILVNFDDERGPLAVQALAEFAKDRQVIVMTCHESTRRMYHDAGALELSLAGIPPK
ncbi:MAG: ATP-binding protein, partial [Chloroflexota bacterium]